MAFINPSPGGRPPLPPDAVRTGTIGVRVSPAELADLRAKAAALCISPAQLLRDCALNRKLPKPPVPAINRDHYADLARMAANINQLAYAANLGKPVTVPATLVAQVMDELRRLRLALLGIEE